MHNTLDQKYKSLQRSLAALGSAAVAFSGGVDSTLLLRAAKDVLGDRVIAITAASTSFPEREKNEAAAYCRENGIRQYIFDFAELSVPGFCENPPDRCYRCKRALFSQIQAIAREHGMAAVVEGSNTDDAGDYRPGMIAIRELGVQSPLRQAGLNKEEIRALSRQLGLPTWSKPSFACLATRFVYGEPITEEKLAMVGGAEQLLLDLNFRQVRVRIHGTIARIEVAPDELERILTPSIREQICARCKALGFSYVTLDLEGYRTGSMNETLGADILQKGILGNAAE